MLTSDTHRFRTRLGVPVCLTQGDGTWKASNDELGQQTEGYGADTTLRAFDDELIQSFDIGRPPLPEWAQSLVKLNRHEQARITWRWPTRPDVEQKVVVLGRAEDVDRLVADMARAGAKPTKTKDYSAPIFPTVDALRLHLKSLLAAER